MILRHLVGPEKKFQNKTCQHSIISELYTVAPDIYNSKNMILQPRCVQTDCTEKNYPYSILPQYNIGMYDFAAPCRS